MAPSLETAIAARLVARRGEVGLQLLAAQLVLCDGLLVRLVRRRRQLLLAVLGVLTHDLDGLRARGLLGAVEDDVRLHRADRPRRR